MLCNNVTKATNQHARPLYCVTLQWQSDIVSTIRHRHHGFGRTPATKQGVELAFVNMYTFTVTYFVNYTYTTVFNPPAKHHSRDIYPIIYYNQSYVYSSLCLWLIN